MNSILTYLRENRRRLGLERYGVPARLSCVLVTPRFRASSHVVFLVLPENKPDPVLVAKVPRIAGANATVEKEVANLRIIQASRRGGFESLPRIIAYEECWGRSLLIETALVGRPMDPPTVRRDPAECARKIRAWLAELQQASSAWPEADTGWFEQLVEAPLLLFERSIRLSSEEGRLLEATWAQAEMLRDEKVPLVVEHGDLSHPNVMLLGNGSPGVVDWELAEPRGLPACDLFFFLTFVAFALHRSRSTGDYLPAFQNMFFGDSAWSKPYVWMYADQFQLSPRTLAALFTLTWLRYMGGLLTRLNGADGSEEQLGPEAAAWLRANRYYGLWRYAATHEDELNWRRPKGIIT
ncbi:MAG: aminoglycoside phosphotransferase family protein [Candidatus Promineifilaceae bacterium]